MLRPLLEVVKDQSPLNGIARVKQTTCYSSQGRSARSVLPARFKTRILSVATALRLLISFDWSQYDVEHIIYNSVCFVRHPSPMICPFFLPRYTVFVSQFVIQSLSGYEKTFLCGRLVSSL